jgi:hypothetical protein
MQRLVLILETSRNKRSQNSASVLESSLTTMRLPRYIDMETEKINTEAAVCEHQKGHNHSHTSHFLLLQQRQFGHQTFADFIKTSDHPDTFAMEQHAMSQEGMNIAILLMLVMLVFYNSCLGFYVWRAERIRSRASHEHGSSHTSPEP